MNTPPSCMIMVSMEYDNDREEAREVSIIWAPRTPGTLS